MSPNTGSTTFPSNYLSSAVSIKSMDESGDVWRGDSGASCHMANDASRMYDVNPSLQTNGKSNQMMAPDREVSMSVTSKKVSHGGGDEPITSCDISYVPGLRFNPLSFHKAQQTHVIILDAIGLWGKILPSRGSYLQAS